MAEILINYQSKHLKTKGGLKPSSFHLLQKLYMKYFNKVDPKVYSRQLLCHLCGDLQPQVELLTHITQCLDRVVEPLPYDKTREFVQLLMENEKKTRQEILDYNNGAFDIYVRYNLMICKACDRYCPKGFENHHYKSCKSFNSVKHSKNDSPMINLFSITQMAHRDKDKSKREIVQLKSEIASFRLEKSRKYMTNQNINKIGKAVESRNMIKPKNTWFKGAVNTSTICDPSLPSNTDIDVVSRVHINYLSSKPEVEASSTKKYRVRTFSNSKKVTDATFMLMLDDYDELFMESHKDINLFKSTINQTDTVLSVLHRRSRSPVAKTRTYSRRLDNDLIKTLRYERSKNNELSPLNAYKSKNRLQAPLKSPKRAYPLNFTSAINVPPSRVQNITTIKHTSKRPCSQASEKSVRNENESNKRSTSSNMAHIRRYSKVEVPKDFAKEIQINLSLVSDNIKKIEDERAILLQKDKRERSLSKTSKKLASDTFEKQEQLATSNIEEQKSYKTISDNNFPPIRVEKTQQIVNKTINCGFYDRFKQKLKPCRHCERCFTGDRLLKHEKVCLERISRKNIL